MAFLCTGRLWDAVRAERRRLTLALRERGFDVPDSHSNFVLAGVPGSSGGGPADARGWYQALKARGVLVRFFDADRLRDKLRITVGTPAQTDTLLRALERNTAALERLAERKGDDHGSA